MAKKRKALTKDELMRVGIRDIQALIESAGSAEKLTPEVEKLWTAVPVDIRQIQNVTTRQKALFAVTFAQAKYWREEGDPEAKLAARTELADKVRAWQKQQVSGGGARRGAVRFDWLDEYNFIPKLRTEVGMSAKGLRKLMSRLKIQLLKCPNKKRGPDFIVRDDALKVLDSRLQRKRRGEGNLAEKIWTTYAIDHATTPGFARLKSILQKHGAKCESRPDTDVTPRPVLPVLGLGDLSSLLAGLRPVNIQ